MSAFTKLYRGETNYNFIGSRKRWYLASGIMIAICILAFVIRGFNFGVEFAGGSQFQIQTHGSSISTSQVEDAFNAAGLPPADAAQEVGSGASRQIVVKTKSVGAIELNNVENSVSKSTGIPKSDINATTVSSDWGRDVTKSAIQALIVFLIVVSIYISFRFQWRMAVGAMIALLHDLIIAAGIYSLIGFEVTPSTVVGLLTILGFSLYDTVVVYDKVSENSQNLLAGSRMTFSEAANLAVNQTLMRSINTSLISLLPVAGLLFVGAGILGVGTIKDLALILFVGLASGAYSSLFLATPLVVDLTERQPAYKQLTRRVMAKRASDKHEAVEISPVAVAAAAAARRGSGPMPAPKPGARPQRRR
ncbi:protein translocase subunit secF [Jatrophihabitans sp. GAS493]|uniref:protein translocase subunit SecF n=1 Tax=Jatrophihabitans sp. GAS493 TaxID=1907575 RepID=UPI000BB6966E|nr:protein translocase subunit SecF [Jatrophihabitans sp. GAS493]SOD74263.1 protein translocase subunit secF [Jatrophihabitans sp. GAS493]